MKCAAIAVALCLASLTARAGEPPTSTLTEKELAEGWLLLFDGKTTFGWTSPNGSHIRSHPTRIARSSMPRGFTTVSGACSAWACRR